MLRYLIAAFFMAPWLYGCSDSGPPEGEASLAESVSNASQLTYEAQECLAPADLASLVLDLDTGEGTFEASIQRVQSDRCEATDGCLETREYDVSFSSSELEKLKDLLQEFPEPTCDVSAVENCTGCNSLLRVDDREFEPSCCGSEIFHKRTAVLEYLRETVTDVRTQLFNEVETPSISYRASPGDNQCFETGRGSVVEANIERGTDSRLMIVGIQSVTGDPGDPECRPVSFADPDDTTCYVQEPFGPLPVSVIDEARLVEAIEDMPAPICFGGADCKSCRYESLVIDGISITGCCGYVTTGFGPAFLSLINVIQTLN